MGWQLRCISGQWKGFFLKRSAGKRLPGPEIVLRSFLFIADPASFSDRRVTSRATIAASVQNRQKRERCRINKHST
jgi:hypothetical protein